MPGFPKNMTLGVLQKKMHCYEIKERYMEWITIFFLKGPDIFVNAQIF